MKSNALVTYSRALVGWRRPCPFRAGEGEFPRPERVCSRSMFLQVLSSGLATGCIYGLVALSFVLVYKATEAVSFMQGELLMVGAFSAVALSAGAGWPLWLAVLAAVAVMALGGALVERLVLRRWVSRISQRCC